MQKPDNDYLLQQLDWRQATKKFDASRKIPDADWHTLEESLRLAPSSWGLQPWKFIVAQSDEARQALSEHNGNKNQFLTCAHLLVIARLKEMDPAYVEKNLIARGTGPEHLASEVAAITKGVVDSPLKAIMPHWTARQAYIALGFFLNTAAMLGIDTCPIEGIHPERFDDILGLKGGPYGCIVAAAAGYRLPDAPGTGGRKQRFRREQVIQFL